MHGTYDLLVEIKQLDRNCRACRERLGAQLSVAAKLRAQCGALAFAPNLVCEDSRMSSRP